MNYRFNLDEWLPQFPLQEDYGHYSAHSITSPWHLCQNEQLRREMKDEYVWGEAFLTDVFIMANGEPPDRHVTKIGGLPYRPANLLWPKSPIGLPLVFLAQVNFCNSKDITGDLPGDVLLIFVDQIDAPEFVHFEWQHLGLKSLTEADGIPKTPREPDPESMRLQKQLLDQVKHQLAGLSLSLPDEIPQPMNDFAPCYGSLFRTANFPDAVQRDALARYPKCRGKDVWSEFLLPSYQATQIGSSPFFIQLSDPNAIIGQLLCTISSVGPAFDVPFPWINCGNPITLESMSKANYLAIGDGGCIYVSIDERGQLHWHWSCY